VDLGVGEFELKLPQCVALRILYLFSHQRSTSQIFSPMMINMIHDTQHNLASLGGGLVGLGVFFIHQIPVERVWLLAFLYIATGMATFCSLSLAIRSHKGKPFIVE
jgi:hypothetical protein